MKEDITNELAKNNTTYVQINGKINCVILFTNLYLYNNKKSSNTFYVDYLIN